MDFMKDININGHLVGANHPSLIIAEIGINHQGDVKIAKKMIRAAKDCGVDAVKFQKRSITKILTKAGLERPYDNRNSFGKTYGEHRYALELSYDDYYELKKLSDDIGVLFSASGWDEESVDFLDELGISFYKVASGDLTNLPLIQHTAKKGKPIIISSGMSGMATLKKYMKPQENSIMMWLLCSVHPVILRLSAN